MLPTEVIVFQCNHYEMEDNKGVSVRIVGSQEETNNKFGLAVSEATVMNFNELDYLKRHKDQLPAKFKCNLHMIQKKSNNGKEITSIGLSDFEFKTRIELTEKQPVKS